MTTNNLYRVLRNRLVENILRMLANDVGNILNSKEVDPIDDDVLTLFGLFGLADLFQYRQMRDIGLISALESLRDKAFTDRAISHATTHAEFRLNKLEEYICNYIICRRQVNDIGQLHWASEAHKVALVLLGFYLAMASQDCWNENVDREYKRFKRVMDYYVWRLKPQPDEECALYSFLSDLWNAAEPMLSAHNCGIEG